jgi:hypothetical protein
MERSERVSSANEVRAVGGFNASIAASSAVRVVGNLAHYLHPRSEGQHLRTLPGRRSATSLFASVLA